MASNPAPLRYKLPADRRVKRAASFREAYRQGNKVVGRFLILWRWEGDDAALRLGTVASKKVGNSVARSRAKRRLREIFRLLQHNLHGDCDVILVARRSILKAPWDLVMRDARKAFSKAGLLQSPGQSSTPPPPSTGRKPADS